MDRPSVAGPGEPAPEQESPAGGTGNKRLRIVTRCSTLDEFFVTFGGFADETSLFIVTNKPRTLGLVQPFVIQLKDGTSIMRGEVEVIQSTTAGEGPEGRNGMRLKFVQADDGTREVLRRLLEYGQAKRSIAPPPGELPGPAAITMRPAAPSETTAVSPSPAPGPSRPATRPEPPSAPSRGPSSTTQISPQADGPSPVARPGPMSSAGTVSDAARAGSDPMLGERAPGAAYQLPANPFESITAEALESFVECTLYEERLPRADEPPIETSVIFALPTAPASVYPPPAPAGVLPAGVVPPPPPAAGLAPAPPTFSAPGAAAPPTFGLASQSAPGSPGTPSAGVVRDAVLLAAAIQAASVPAAQTRRLWIIGATAVASSIASLVGAYLVWGRTPDMPEVSTSLPAASSAPATTTTPPDRTGAPTAPPAPSTSTAPTSVLPRECRAHIRSYPNGASVLWNNETLGTTPLVEAAVPCGPARVTFQMRGYESGERSANAIVYKSAGVFLRLVPVRVPVDITSTPSGADILVNGRPMGRTPATITLVGPNASVLLLRTAGYKPDKREVVPEPPRVTVNVNLEKK